jgi:NAD(P)H-hydrate epimerase
MRVLDAKAMRGVDRAAIETLGIPGLVLMENAAIGVVDAVGERFPEASRIVIFCGPGNNGGDGLAVARQLAARGHRPEIGLVFGGREASGDCAVQLRICERMGLAPRVVGNGGEALALGAGSDLVIDALFGTGLDRALAGAFAEVIAAIAALRAEGAAVLAVDLPSGLDASRAQPIGPHVEADLTVTFAAPKIAHVLAPASAAAGELVVADLGIPPELIEQAEGGLSLLTADELATYVAPRDPAAHKGAFGHALLVAGARDKSGAAVLAARAAVRGGAGLVTVATADDALPLVAVGSIESMTVGLPSAESGLQSGALALLERACEGKRAVALGPGLGTASGTREVVRAFVLGLDLPLVLDADGLNAFAGDAAALRVRRAATVVTPHPGELARLVGETVPEIEADRPAAATRAALATGAIVVLKGHRTLVATPEGEVFINPTGNPGMASGGSGDVLTGLLVALLAQGYEPLAAAQLGVYLHGARGSRRRVDRRGRPARLRPDRSCLPRALAALVAS